MSQRRVARGEFPIYVPMTMTDILRLEGLPVRAISPSEGNPYVVFSLAILKGARNPNAARLLINYFLDPDSSREFHLNGKLVTVPTTQDGLSAKLQSLINNKLMGKQERASFERDMALFNVIYK